MTTGLGQNCVTRGRGPLEIPFCKPQIGAKTETWLENSWRRSDNIVGDLEENYDLSTHEAGGGLRKSPDFFPKNFNLNYSDHGCFGDFRIHLTAL